ncbi:hypothetical protein SLIQ_00385 [Serratia liquefaciens FK01]|nr:hypothetical protein SLIQ_00385 [Serratia liquefaciens FK01]
MRIFGRFSAFYPVWDKAFAFENIANRTACGNVKRDFMVEKPLTNFIWPPVRMSTTKENEAVYDIG